MSVELAGVSMLNSHKVILLSFYMVVTDMCNRDK